MRGFLIYKILSHQEILLIFLLHKWIWCSRIQQPHFKGWHYAHHRNIVSIGRCICRNSIFRLVPC